MQRQHPPEVKAALRSTIFAPASSKALFGYLASIPALLSMLTVKPFLLSAATEAGARATLEGAANNEAMWQIGARCNMFGGLLVAV